MIARRRILTLFSLGVTALAVPSLAQKKTKLWRIGFLFPGSPPMQTHRMAGFVRGLRELGYVEGRDIVIEWRFADGKYERAAGLAAELVRLNVDVFVAASDLGVSAARQASAAIPIVMVGASDPVGLGFVASLSRPGGNITGVSSVRVDVSAKHLEFLLAIVPKLSRVAVLLNLSNPSAPGVLKMIEVAAKTAGVSVSAFDASTAGQIDAAFGSMARAHAGALIMAPDPFLHDRLRQIAELAANSRLPAIYPSRPHVEAGGLMSYGPNDVEIFRQPARYVDKIFKGAKPADLPVEQPMTFELVINMKTAKALGLKIPQALLLRADEVIE